MESSESPQPPELVVPDSSRSDLAGFLRILQAVLESRRDECKRPEDIEQMSEEQVRVI